MDIEPEMTRAMKTFRRVARYGTAVGRIMVREAGLFNWQRVERLIEADFHDALRILLETRYGKYLEGVTVSKEIEDGLQRFMADEYRFLDEVCAGTLVAEFMHAKYDFHNLKVALKRLYFGGEEEEMISRLGSIDPGDLELSVEKQRSGFLPGYMERAIERTRASRERLGDDPQILDTAIERLFLERRLELARREKSRFLVSFARAAIDVVNLKLLLRGRGVGKGRDYFVEALCEGGRLGKTLLLELAGESPERLNAKLLATQYGRMLDKVLEAGEGSAGLSSLDRASDEFLVEKLGSSRRIAVGPERIVTYMMALENEVAVLRIVLMGKLHGVSSVTLEARLSPVYSRGGP